MDEEIQERVLVAVTMEGYWGKHRGGWTVEDWQYEVANGDTREGYWEWCAAKEISQENGEA
jgi:hypothetical protein